MLYFTISMDQSNNHEQKLLKSWINLFFLQFDYLRHFVSWWKTNILAVSLLENDKKETFSISLLTQCYHETKMGMNGVQSRLQWKYREIQLWSQNYFKTLSKKTQQNVKRLIHQEIIGPCCIDANLVQYLKIKVIHQINRLKMNSLSMSNKSWGWEQRYSMPCLG